MWAEHLEPAELEPSGQMFPSKFLVQFSPIKKPTTKKKKSQLLGPVACLPTGQC